MIKMNKYIGQKWVDKDEQVHWSKMGKGAWSNISMFHHHFHTCWQFCDLLFASLEHEAFRNGVYCEKEVYLLSKLGFTVKKKHFPLKMGFYCEKEVFPVKKDVFPLKIGFTLKKKYFSFINGVNCEKEVLHFHKWRLLRTGSIYY